jgi:hypothetical protein
MRNKLNIVLAAILLVLPLSLYASQSFIKLSGSGLPQFGFHLTNKLPWQGMSYGPLNSKKHYVISCKVLSNPQKQKLSITVCYKSKKSAALQTLRNACSSNAEQLTLTLQDNSQGLVFTTGPLSPRMLSKKLAMKLKTPSSIFLHAKLLEKLKGKEPIKGICGIREVS